MKPGNLARVKVPNPAATKDEDSIESTSDPGVRFFVRKSLLLRGRLGCVV